MANQNQPQANQPKEYLVKASDLIADKRVVLQGTVVYSRVLQPMNERELADHNARKSFTVIGDNYKLVLANTSVVPHPVQDPEDPIFRDGMTANEYYVHERMYNSNNNPERNPQYELVAKSGNTLPLLFERREDNTYHQVVDAPGELASGQRVTVVIHAYKPKNNNNHGLSIDEIYTDGPYQAYLGGGNRPSLDPNYMQQLGITVSGPIQRQSRDDSGSNQSQPTGAVAAAQNNNFGASAPATSQQGGYNNQRQGGNFQQQAAPQQQAFGGNQQQQSAAPQQATSPQFGGPQQGGYSNQPQQGGNFQQQAPAAPQQNFGAPQQPHQGGFQPNQQATPQPQQGGFQPNQQATPQPQQGGFQPNQQATPQPQQGGFQPQNNYGNQGGDNSGNGMSSFRS